MNLTSMKRYCSRIRHVWLSLGILSIALPLSAKTVRIYITNSAGETVSVVDPETNKVVQVIEGVELTHGIGFSPDGKRVYLTLESHRTLADSDYLLDVVDQKTGKVIKQVTLSGRPNTLAVSKDGGKIYVGIVAPEGALDIVDTTSLERVKSIPMRKGGLHDVYVTPDGKYVVSGGYSPYITVVDVQTEKIAWDLKMDGKINPLAFETNPDGSTRRIFAQFSGFYGFAVIDFATHKEVTRIKLPDKPDGGIDPTAIWDDHGIGVSPDNKTLWVNSSRADSVFAYSLPDLKLLGYVRIGEVPEWITFTPDSKQVYVSNSGGNSVSAIDVKTLKEVARIPVGEQPRRIATLFVP